MSTTAPLTIAPTTPPAAASCGVLLHSGDPGWDAARATFNLLDDQQPEAIALPSTADEVAAAIAWAKAHDLRVTGQGTGHAASSLPPLHGALLINTSRLDEIQIDPARCVVRVGAGVRWSDVTPQLAEHGLTALHGSSLDVGITGYSLGGGLGWLARKHGLHTNRVRAIELVTAEGDQIRADHLHHAELFWALRGGGGSFGIVTAIEFEVVPIATAYSGALFFPVDRVAEVLRTWAGLLPSFPEELTSWLTVLHFPPLDEIPEPFRGQSFVIAMGAYLGSEADGRRLLQPLRELGPAIDTFAEQATTSLGTLAMDPESPVPYRSTTALLDELPDETIEQIARLARRPSPLTLIQLRHNGGALARVPEGAGARATLAGEITLFGLGIAPHPSAEAMVGSALADLDQAIAAHRVGSYRNFVERPGQAADFFDDASYARLARVKAAYDPDDQILGNHPVTVPVTGPLTDPTTGPATGE